MMRMMIKERMMNSMIMMNYTPMIIMIAVVYIKIGSGKKLNHHHPPPLMIMMMFMMMDQ